MWAIFSVTFPAPELTPVQAYLCCGTADLGSPWQVATEHPFPYCIKTAHANANQLFVLFMKIFVHANLDCWFPSLQVKRVECPFEREIIARIV